MSVEKSGSYLPVSAELLAETPLQLSDVVRELMRPLSPERQAQIDAYAAERAAERAKAPRIELTVDRLIDKLGWSRAYAEHFVQSYCDCGDSMMGWERCIHANDEGLKP